MRKLTWRCIKSVDWADEIFVVDSQSSDKTPEIAQKYGAKVIQFRYQGGWPKKKNWALKIYLFPTNGY